ncbi:hypothetical protein BFW38_09080 [Terasakiispira papahanaumokuakeensis]|uniref:Periplasmic chaperone PpiD n=1 Tax=Terasakiispira papahanaumokuakeensis TaxID=197479 RepID=A0A1E2VAK0_9GAMM|nr:SurA N-terminal domain-containing protein [Terasakiispira papahanaumokuakeensis]ODC03675.1 hypothetical protein BFW38_09080 [Terasakiispira papahanaumokuakeensis]
MLQRIREKSQGIIAYTLVGVIALTFALWGVQSLVGAMGNDGSTMAKVEGTSITRPDVERRAQEMLRQVLSNNDQVSPEDINQDMLRQFALNELIQKAVVRHSADQLDMRVSDALVERMIVQNPAFADDQGRFDAELFKQRLRQQGLTPVAYRQQLHEQLLAQQLIGGVAASEFVLPEEAAATQALVTQTRDYQYAVLSAKALADKIELSDQDLDTYYQAHLDRYMAPEHIQVQYVVLDPQDFADDINVTDDQYQQAYERYREQMSKTEQRSAAHILLTFDSPAEREKQMSRLETMRKQLASGEADFADLAQQYSEDPATADKGGELGVIQPGSLDDQFETALDQLKKVGDISPVVETPYGLHLIELTGLNAKPVPPLSDVKSQLRQQIIQQPLKAKMSDRIETLKNLSFSRDQLTQVADEMNLKLSESPILVKGQLTGFWAEDKVAAALFSKEITEDHWISEPVSLKDGRYVAFQSEEYQPRQQQALSEVKDDVRKQLLKERVADQNWARAEQMLDALEQGKQPSLSWQSVDNAARGRSEAPAAVNQQAFKLTLDAQDVARVHLSDGDVALVKLNAVHRPKVSPDSDGVSNFQQALIRRQMQQQQQMMLSQLRQQADVEMSNGAGQP